MIATGSTASSGAAYGKVCFNQDEALAAKFILRGFAGLS